MQATPSPRSVLPADRGTARAAAISAVVVGPLITVMLLVLASFGRSSGLLGTQVVELEVAGVLLGSILGARAGSGLWRRWQAWPWGEYMPQQELREIAREAGSRARKYWYQAHGIAPDAAGRSPAEQAVATWNAPPAPSVGVTAPGHDGAGRTLAEARAADAQEYQRLAEQVRAPMKQAERFVGTAALPLGFLLQVAATIAYATNVLAGSGVTPLEWLGTLAVFYVAVAPFTLLLPGFVVTRTAKMISRCLSKALGVPLEEPGRRAG